MQALAFLDGEDAATIEGSLEIHPSTTESGGAAVLAIQVATASKSRAPRCPRTHTVVNAQ